MQEEILEQLSNSHFRSSAKTKELLHRLIGVSLCGEHRRQQDRLERRWMKDIEFEKGRKKMEGKRQRRRVEMENGEDGGEGEGIEGPESPSPVARGLGRRPPPSSTSGTRQTRKIFDRLATREPRIPPPIFIKKSGASPPTITSLRVPTNQLPTPRTTPDLPKWRPIFTSNTQDPPAPSINALIDTGRKYSSRSSLSSTSNPDLVGMATRIPKPTTEPVHRGVYPSLQGAGLWTGHGRSAASVDSTVLEEMWVLQDNIMKNQQKILQDQARIFEILMGDGGVEMKRWVGIKKEKKPPEFLRCGKR